MGGEIKGWDAHLLETVVVHAPAGAHVELGLAEHVVGAQARQEQLACTLHAAGVGAGENGEGAG